MSSPESGTRQPLPGGSDVPRSGGRHPLSGRPDVHDEDRGHGRGVAGVAALLAALPIAAAPAVLLAPPAFAAAKDANLAVLAVTTTPIRSDGRAAYTVTVRNIGPGVAKATKVSSKLGTGVTYAEGPPKTSSAARTVTTQVGDVPAGTTVTVTIRVRVDERKAESAPSAGTSSVRSTTEAAQAPSRDAAPMRSAADQAEQANTPSAGPDQSPSASPDVSPSAAPDQSPSAGPDQSPSAAPDVSPSAGPNLHPSAGPDLGMPIEPRCIVCTPGPTATPTPSASLLPAPATPPASQAATARPAVTMTRTPTPYAPGDRAPNASASASPTPSSTEASGAVPYAPPSASPSTTPSASPAREALAPRPGTPAREGFAPPAPAQSPTATQTLYLAEPPPAPPSAAVPMLPPEARPPHDLALPPPQQDRDLAAPRTGTDAQSPVRPAPRAQAAPSVQPDPPRRGTPGRHTNLGAEVRDLLPFTGLPLALLAGAAGILLLAGILATRAAHRRSRG